MIAFIPVSTFALYVPFDSTFVYLGYLPDLYIITEPDDESSNKVNLFSIGRLCTPFHRSFGIGVRKPRFIGDPHDFYMKYMNTEYLLKSVNCLNIRNRVYCWFSSRVPVNQSEMEKVLLLERFSERTHGYDSEESSLVDFLFSDFLISGTIRSWGKYMCLCPKDQEAILSFISDSSDYLKTSFSMMPVDLFYKSSIEQSLSDLKKESFWSSRFSLKSYIDLGNVYRS